MIKTHIEYDDFGEYLEVLEEESESRLYVAEGKSA